jgi:hypothetical protein
MTRPGQVVYIPANLPHIRMQAAAAMGAANPELMSIPPEVIVPTEGIGSWSYDRHHTFPPSEIYGMDSLQLLHNWADFEDNKITSMPQELRSGVEWVQPRAEAMVLHNMIDALTQRTNTIRALDLKATETLDGSTVSRTWSRRDRAKLYREMLFKPFEMVGLIQKNAELPKLDHESSHGALLALGAFARQKLDDDSRGSLQAKVEEHYGKGPWSRGFWGRPKKQFAAFAIRGLAGAPGLTTSQDLYAVSKVLLQKILWYAQTERRIVVVHYPFYIGSDGTDLTEYYVRLGFEKLEMENGMHELVYTGRSVNWADNSWMARSRFMAKLDILPSIKDDKNGEKGLGKMSTNFADYANVMYV